MRVLVTGGNTVVPIDRVRCISNVFRGRTGANIALEAYQRGHHVHLLASDPDVIKPEIRAALPPDRWKLERYHTFDDLHEAMRRAIENDKVDVVIHSAAVSDYRVEGIFAADTGTHFHPETRTWEGRDGTPPRMADRSAGKVRSNEPEMWLRMVQNPKLIDLIRPCWHFSGILVKFKLEVGVDEHELLEIAERSRTHSAADLVVANTITGLTFIGPVGGKYERMSNRRELLTRLLATVEALAEERTGRKDAAS
ncbi:MAG: bifunctional phosphopantothenoylcysteine decarboxylase/phosphopantothenate synthase [Planctomycetaceae bacterium]|nr:bifunctional phosphopantothenoylcysteine decarboxylase/phosphopantothenate synthase [Planctomycetaceae bacterium]